MGSIHTHISNFINTWEGWYNVIDGLTQLNFKNIYDVLKAIGEVVNASTSAVLSSK
ncbi:hypothetical protein ACDL59_04975 [Corynebacterium diphtheriae]|uniref:hypothetical protein n=1 Tax=Corynebacterium diphtheriae TaxID=1717 RepID=UPI0013CA2B5C|nr:hypothetical protein FRC0076_01922 [Corynebacterium diphtheriae]CAB0709582.1 hypothetical protein FRC0077_01932 [Corynebacterium diphtheriae]